MNWTQEQRDELIALWDNGKRSYSEIARILGISKNAVVGRMRREKKIRGLPVEHQHAHFGARPRPRINPKPKATRRRKMPPVSLPAPDDGVSASIADVTGCRWEITGSHEIADYRFCNHATDGSSYCPYHQEMSVASYSRSLISKTVRSAWHAYHKRAA